MSRPRKFGGMACLKNAAVRRHLFFNSRKNLSLNEILEFANCQCIGKYWEVVRVRLSEDASRLERETILKTPIYAIAWDMVKDPEFDGRKR